MTTNKPEVVTMSDRYPESGCYQCGRLKTALSYRSRCLTCETQRADANADENDELRAQLSDCEALQAELETAKKVAYGNIELLERNEALQAECDALVEALEEMIDVAIRVDGWESFPSAPIDRAVDAILAYRQSRSTIHKERLI